MDMLTSMSVFVRTVEIGSFVGAAEDADISPTMAAKHVQFLERRLGARLLNRTTRRQSLTEIGRLYYQRCKALLADANAAEEVVTQMQAAPRGLLRITAPLVMGAHLVAYSLGDYLTLYPQVQVDLVLTDRVVNLVEEGFDLAVRSGPLHQGGFVARPLRPLRMLLAASPAYLKRHGEPRKPSDLSRHCCLDFAHWARHDVWRLLGPRGEVRVPVKGNLRINSGEALRQAALAGSGIIMQSELLLADDIARGRLIRVLPRYAPPERAAQLIYQRDRSPTPKLRSFVDFMLQRFGAQT